MHLPIPQGELNLQNILNTGRNFVDYLGSASQNSVLISIVVDHLIPYYFHCLPKKLRIMNYLITLVHKENQGSLGICCCSVAMSCPTLLQPHGMQPARLLCPWDYPRQDYWSGLPFPSLEDFPNPGIKPVSPA